MRACQQLVENMAAKNISNTNAMIYDTPTVTQEHDFLFDLRGYLLLPSALPERLVSDLNSGIDQVPPLQPQQWYGHVHRNDYSESWGYNLQNIVEGGAPFEEAMDCPGFLPWVKRYAGHDGAYIDCSEYSGCAWWVHLIKRTGPHVARRAVHRRGTSDGARAGARSVVAQRWP